MSQEAITFCRSAILKGNAISHDLHTSGVLQMGICKEQFIAHTPHRNQINMAACGCRLWVSLVGAYTFDWNE